MPRRIIRTHEELRQMANALRGLPRSGRRGEVKALYRACQEVLPPERRSTHVISKAALERILRYADPVTAPTPSQATLAQGSPTLATYSLEQLVQEVHTRLQYTVEALTRPLLMLQDLTFSTRDLLQKAETKRPATACYKIAVVGPFQQQFTEIQEKVNAVLNSEQTRLHLVWLNKDHTRPAIPAVHYVVVQRHVRHHWYNAARLACGPNYVTYVDGGESATVAAILNGYRFLNGLGKKEAVHHA